MGDGPVVMELCPSPEGLELRVAIELDMSCQHGSKKREWYKEVADTLPPVELDVGVPYFHLKGPVPRSCAHPQDWSSHSHLLSELELQ